MNTNISTSPHSSEEALAKIFSLLGQPARLQILLAIGQGDICVCHLEAALGYRQAYISQQLMALREAGLVIAYREGRFIYYHLADERILHLIRAAAEIAGLPLPQVAIPAEVECPFPAKSPGGKCEEEESHGAGNLAKTATMLKK